MPGRVTAALPRAGHLTGRHGVANAVRHFTAGGAVLVWDPAIEGEADVILPETRLKPESFTFLLTQVCGYPCVPCATAVLERLEIEALPGEGDRQHTAFCMPVDRAAGQGTGVSAAERAATVRRLADPAARPGDFSRPGHAGADRRSVRKKSREFTDLKVPVSALRRRPGRMGRRPAGTGGT